MKLSTLTESSKKKVAKQALREHYNTNLDYDRMDFSTTRLMLMKVRGLLKEQRSSRSYHNSHTSPAYMKLVVMEQGLSAHYNDLYRQRKIMFENEEVEKSQVILAAKDMIDSIQKMIEQISKMNAEELPAVVEGISNEFGTSESESFNQTVGEALSTLQQALSAAKTGVNGALGTITGQGDSGFEAGAPDMGVADDMAAAGDMGGDMEEPAAGEELPETPPAEEEPTGPAGRELR